MTFSSDKQTDTLKEAILREQILLLFKQTPFVSLSNIPAALIAVYVLRLSVPMFWLLLWAGLLIFFSAVRIYPILVFQKMSNQNIQFWKWFSINTVVFMGSIWGCLGLFLIFELPRAQEYFIVLLLLGLSSSALIANQAYLGTFLALIIPALTPVVFVFFSKKSPEYSGLGILLILYSLILINAARVSVDNTRRTILLNMENRKLAEKLSKTKAELFTEVEEKKEIQRRLEELQGEKQ